MTFQLSLKVFASTRNEIAEAAWQFGKVSKRKSQRLIASWIATRHLRVVLRTLRHFYLPLSLSSLNDHLQIHLVAGSVPLNRFPQVLLTGNRLSFNCEQNVVLA